MVIEMKSMIIALVVLSCFSSLVEAQSNPHYMAADPAIKEMLISMDMPRYTGSVPAENIDGNWQLVLTDGKRIELALLQSGSAVFGKGNMTIGTIPQGAFASGSVSGSSLNLEIVPESGTELYAISVDISSLPFEGAYIVFLADIAPLRGTLRASKESAGA